MLVNEFPFFNSEDCDKIKQYAYEKEKQFASTINKVKYNNSVTTNNYDSYNFFGDHPVYTERLVSLLKESNAPLEWPILVQSWVNIYRKGDGIGWHNHCGDGLSLNIFIDGDTEPGPAYVIRGIDDNFSEYKMETRNFKNKQGVMQIFPSAVYHKVDPLISELERITVAATIHSYTAINRKVLNLLSFNNKIENGIIILSK
tara:strand:+ start:50 stop:652 length:603 start_codon:yes stop_codon:yes gene_type:complete